MVAEVQAKLKPEFSLRCPHLNPRRWYDVVPVFPGVTERRTTLSGERLTRIRGPYDFETLKGEYFEFQRRSGPAGEIFGNLQASG